MIAILERTQSNVQQNIEQLQTPTMGVTINKKSTTTEPHRDSLMVFLKYCFYLKKQTNNNLKLM